MTNEGKGVRKHHFSRRKLLLAGSTAAGASALGSTGSVETAQAQMREAPQAASAGLPNILVIFGDDIGQTNISAYSFGLMGFETPNIDFASPMNAGCSPTITQRTVLCVVPVIHHGHPADAHRPLQGWRSRRHGWTTRSRYHHSPGTEAA